MANNPTQEDYWDDPTEDDFVSLGHFMGRITRSFWSNAAAESEGKATYDGADNTQLYWELEVLDVLQEDYDAKVPESMTINLGIGKKWWVDPENEDVVEHEDDDPDADKLPKFHPQSAYGKILLLVAGKDPEDIMDDFIVLDGGDELDITTVNYDGVRKYFRDNGYTNARTASIWNGMIFEFRGLAREMKDVKKPRSKPFPARYAGVDADNLPEMASGENGDSGGSDEVAWTADAATARTLNQLMGKADTHDDFVANAVLLPKVKNNEELLAEVQDPGNFKA